MYLFSLLFLLNSISQFSEGQLLTSLHRMIRDEINPALHQLQANQLTLRDQVSTLNTNIRLLGGVQDCTSQLATSMIVRLLQTSGSLMRVCCLFIVLYCIVFFTA
jgi:hypothetical protein